MENRSLLLTHFESNLVKDNYANRSMSLTDCAVKWF